MRRREKAKGKSVSSSGASRGTETHPGALRGMYTHEGEAGGRGGTRSAFEVDLLKSSRGGERTPERIWPTRSVSMF